MSTTTTVPEIRSEDTAERNLDGWRLRPLLALYGAGRTHFLRTTRHSRWMPDARRGLRLWSGRAMGGTGWSARYRAWTSRRTW